jgi:hypothetical protein
MNLTYFIHVPAFIISFAIGMFAVYIMTNDESRKIYIYPSPENVNLIQYKDSAGTCFKYNQHKVSCPANPKDISVVPIQ